MATDILNKHLKNACVESFGLSHQMLFIDFRDDLTNDHRLSIDADIASNALLEYESGLTSVEKALLLFNKINLKQIEGIKCTENGTLELQFEEGTILIIGGVMSDEPWQIGSEASIQDGGYIIISEGGGSYTIFSPQLK